MDFIQHTINWSRGEITEALINGIGGLVLVICGILFLKLGNTPNAKALVWPLIAVGLLLGIAGAYGVYSNKIRINEFEQQWNQNPKTFVEAEKKRVEGFDEIFKYSYPGAIILVIAGAILFFVFKGANGKAISLGLMLVGMAAYFIDFFASERAQIYYKEIIKEISKY
ncbi:hypothetical protein EMN47_01335 [Prolixibacteraceae bacterium JC049]|nr:hypothetical protein [Prolixibacteraceae bacterium JC049]